MKGIDGVDHINLYSKGKTELGRLLSNFALSPIKLPKDGQFESIEGYWYWLSTGDNRLRYLYGFEAKEVGRSLPKLLKCDRYSEAGFRKKIDAALRDKVKRNPRIRRLLIKSYLPFEHYYVYGDKVVNAGYGWWVQLWEDIRTELRNR